MLKEYVAYISESFPELKRILLLSKPELVRFYVNAGFTVLGLSSVQHGKVCCSWKNLLHSLTE